MTGCDNPMHGKVCVVTGAASGIGAVTALAVRNGRLYAASANRKTGFQLWSLGAVGEDWVQHLKDGAARFAMNCSG